MMLSRLSIISDAPGDQRLPAQSVLLGTGGKRLTDLHFENQVAIVTGAGRGLGREFAKALAQRGASVVVNDIGCDPSGTGSDPSVAEGVVDEITKAGGVAEPACLDVTETGAPARLAQLATDLFGHVDILVNNVGSMGATRDAPIYARSVQDIDFAINTNLRSAIDMSTAVWEAFERQQYGRIVNISSGAALGLIPEFDYAAAKAGVIGFTKSLALAGSPIGIKVNAVMPNAFTPGADRGGRDPKLLEYASVLAPEFAAPIVCVLAHSECPVEGEIFSSAGHLVSRIVLGETAGRVFDELSPEAVLASMAEILDASSVSYPASARAQAESYARRLWRDAPEAPK